MREVARYYASLPEPLPSSLPQDAPLAIERGQAIASLGVPPQRAPAGVARHGPGATTAIRSIPRLAGQFADYLVLQLELFKKAHRGGLAGPTPTSCAWWPPGSTSETCGYVALYYASLPMDLQNRPDNVHVSLSGDNAWSPKKRDSVATLRDALHQLEGTLGRTREGVDEIASQAERLRAGVEALGELRQREDTSVGIEMFVDAAVDLLEAFRALDSGILDVQAEVDTLEAEMADDEDGRERLTVAPPGERLCSDMFPLRSRTRRGEERHWMKRYSVCPRLASGRSPVRIIGTDML